MVEEIYFSDENIFSKISEILEKNGIEENVVEAMFKEQSFISIVLHLVKDFAKEKISEKDFVLSLQKNLNISSQISENIIKEIKEKILPSAEKITIGTQAETEKSITASPIRLITEENENITEKIKPEHPVVPTKKTRIKDINKPAEIKKPASSPGKPDNYREPIE
jgi:hypothetical protein